MSRSPLSSPRTGAWPAFVLLAHDDPTHVRRLVAELDPFPVFLHCDARTPADVFDRMTRDLPDRCVLLPRVATPWARWPVVGVEIEGLRTALGTVPGLTHVVVASGADYPLVSAAGLLDFLDEHVGESVMCLHPLPFRNWGRAGGLQRLRWFHTAWRRHIVRFPIPRRLPGDVVLTGAEHWKVLARHHAHAVVETADARPDLVRFWKGSWAPDETFVPSVLNTPAFTPDFAATHLDDEAWYIGWDTEGQKSPPNLTDADFDTLHAAARGTDGAPPRLLARKFATGTSDTVLDRLDAFRASTDDEATG